MTQILEIVLSLNGVIIGKQTIEWFDENDDQNDGQILGIDTNAKNWSQITVSYTLSQVICFTSKLISCINYRTKVINNLKSILSYKQIPDQVNDRECIDTNQMTDSIGLNKIIILNDIKSMEATLINKLWNRNVLHLLVIRSQLEESLAWLSTLGGAYSSLGENDSQWAFKAAEISITQLRLAHIYGDPNLVARCGLYMVYSLCQRHEKKDSIKMIKKTVYPYISRIVNCDKIVKSMYTAICYRIKHLDHYKIN